MIPAKGWIFHLTVIPEIGHLEQTKLHEYLFEKKTDLARFYLAWV